MVKKSLTLPGGRTLEGCKCVSATRQQNQFPSLPGEKSFHGVNPSTQRGCRWKGGLDSRPPAIWLAVTTRRVHSVRAGDHGLLIRGCRQQCSLPRASVTQRQVLAGGEYTCTREGVGMSRTYPVVQVVRRDNACFDTDARICRGLPPPRSSLQI